MTRAARRADSLITARPPRATRSARCSASIRARFAVVAHGAGRPPDVEPVPEARAARAARAGRARGSCCAWRPSARTRTRSCCSARCRMLPDDAWWCSLGHAEPYEDELRALAAELGVSERVRFLGYVPDARARGPLAPRRLRGLPDPRRGLRPAGDRGDGARRAGGLLRHAGAARGGRRACAHYFTPGRRRRCGGRDRGGAGPTPAAPRRRAASGPRASPGTGRRARHWEAYERALAAAGDEGRASISSSSCPGETGGMEVYARELARALARPGRTT